MESGNFHYLAVMNCVSREPHSAHRKNSSQLSTGVGYFFETQLSKFDVNIGRRPCSNIFVFIEVLVTV